MKLAEVVKQCNLELTPTDTSLDREVTGGYCSDLLSDVMAHGRKGNIWITLQAHPNIIAVAVLKELSAIVLVNGRKPDGETINKARSEKVPLLMSELSAFDLIGQLYGLGLRGTL
ncbi:MAG: serine kinase [candidate division WOR-3 bacterium]|nr:MAG: serine kinase [candidate division WOR-3 bacterium]